MAWNALISSGTRASAPDVARQNAERARSATTRSGFVEPVVFWLFVAALAWTPFWYGSNDLIAWGINAVVFPGLVVLYELSLLIGGARHPVGLRQLALPGLLWATVVAYAWLQTATWPHSLFAHPIWSMAADALGTPLPGTISVDPDLTVLALVRLVTAASVFWLAVQLCRNAARAHRFLNAVAATGCAYAAYGIVAFASGGWRIPWLQIPSGAFVTSTFINHNSFATYAGLGLIATAGLALQLYRANLAGQGPPWGLQIATLLETTGQKGALLLTGAFVILVALLLTGSRGGVLSTGLGLFVLGIVMLGRGRTRSAGLLAAVAIGAVLVAATIMAFGDPVLGNLAQRGIVDTGRMAIYRITALSILDAPWLGHGYGAFADVFPMYRDRSISVQGVWGQAHNTYLEVFQGLGLIFGTMLVACVVLPMVSCLRGAMTRQENYTAPCVAVGAACLVGLHATADFSLQIQAVALTFVAILGAGVAQSQSSRLALHD